MPAPGHAITQLFISHQGTGNSTANYQNALHCPAAYRSALAQSMQHSMRAWHGLWTVQTTT